MKHEDQVFVYSASAAEVQSENELNIEIYPFSHGMSCTGEPIRVINNFEDLILFIEQIPDTE
ncbi:MAG: hypothetical protein Q8906_05605 [Bacillota bacterium]|nr:hypothetical protein [Bacillota bacterium]